MNNLNLIILITLAVSPITFTNAQTTGPSLPNPIVLPALEGKATVRTTTVYDQSLEKDISTHFITIEGEAARPLFNSLTMVPQKVIPASNIQQEKRLGRNVQCLSRIYLAGKPNQKITCEMTVTEGEYLDLNLAQIPQETNERLRPAKTSTATAKVQALQDGVHVTIVGVPPNARGANEIYNTLTTAENDSQSTAVQGYKVKTKNMMLCAKATTKFETTVSCSTVFKSSIALIQITK